MTSVKTSNLMDQFAQDVGQGLSASVKSIPSKYFYDENGDKIFQEIMEMPEYYLTKCEHHILENSKREIINAIDPGKKCFDIIEMGAGDGYKTKIILRYLIEMGCDVQYMPIDISSDGLQKLKSDLEQEFSGLKVEGIAMDYFEALNHVENFSCRSKVFLFLGSNLGNFNHQEAIDFLKVIASSCVTGDKLLIGLDLKKDPSIILNAYNDKSGITCRFNLNLLERINRELGANFNIKEYIHFPMYDPQSGKAISYLISLKDQEVTIPANNMVVHFKKWEPILTEISQKYDLDMIREMASISGFQVRENFFGEKEYFVNSLWERI